MLVRKVVYRQRIFHSIVRSWGVGATAVWPRVTSLNPLRQAFSTCSASVVDNKWEVDKAVEGGAVGVDLEVGAAGGSEQSSAVQDHLERVLASETSQLHPLWVRRLAAVDRPAARALITQLTSDNVLGYQKPPTVTTPSKRKATLLDFVVAEKTKHADKILLVRVGDFYECYGADAVMLVQYAGLNPMGGRARAGCPIRNVQATLDSLTGVGLVVAVYEELQDPSSGAGGSKVGLKSRALSQIISPGISTYLYDLRLRHEDIEFRVNRPAIAVHYSEALGYALCEVHLDERCVHVSERVTEEALKMAITYSGCLEPVYAVGFEGTSTGHRRAGHMLRALVPGAGRIVSLPTGPSSGSFHEAVLQRIEQDLEICTDGFRVMRRPYAHRPAPLYASTALQIGLLPNANVPDLVPFLLPRDAPASAIHFLRRWLLTPPPFSIADQFHHMCSVLNQKDKKGNVFLPTRTSIVPVGKIVSLLRAGECNVALFRDIFNIVSVPVRMLKHNASLPTASRADILSEGGTYASLVEALRVLTEFEAGTAVNCEALLSTGEHILNRIDGTIFVNAEVHHVATDSEVNDIANQTLCTIVFISSIKLFSFIYGLGSDSNGFA